MKAVLAGFTLACVAAPAFAQEAAPQDQPTQSRCIYASIPKGWIAERNGRWIELTSDQWQFLRGIYAMNPQTPPGLPYGDHAVLAQVGGEAGGLIFFIDGDKACTPMPVPKELIDMLRDIGAGTITHDGDGT
jgi:hypothetical protein